MLIWIWTRDDETGLLDNEFKDGDVFKTELDSFESSIGNQEKKSWLIIKVPDPPAGKIADVRADLSRPEYRPGATPADDNIVRHKRIYRLDWRTRFTAEEIAVLSDTGQMLPSMDGDPAAVPLDSGGIVTAGVVSDKFTLEDLARK